jgi:hypothetical protein
MPLNGFGKGRDNEWLVSCELDDCAGAEKRGGRVIRRDVRLPFVLMYNRVSVSAGMSIGSFLITQDDQTITIRIPRQANSIDWTIKTPLEQFGQSDLR